MSQPSSQLLSLRIPGFLIALLLFGIPAVLAQAEEKNTIKIRQDNSEKEIEVAFGDDYEDTDLASDIRVKDYTSLTVTTDFHARILVYWNGTACDKVWVATEGNPIELDRQSLLCGDNLNQGGYLLIKKGDREVRIAELRKPSFTIVGDDLGIVLNIVSRSKQTDMDGNVTSSEKNGFRYFDGASFYASLSNLKSKKWRFIGMLSALDFRDDIDFEAGLGVGFLYKPSANRNFSFAVTRGYNFMVEDDGEPWYTMIGFGWNFNRSDSN